MRYRLLICITFLLGSLRLPAQLMPFTNYGIKDGLNDNNVLAVIKDDRGLLWIGTDVSVYWFDGKRFYQAPLRMNIGQLYVLDLYKDRNGDVWVLTFFNGLYKYHDGVFTNYLIDTVQKNAAKNSVSGMVQVADGRYLVIGSGCTYLFQDGRFTIFDPANTLSQTNTNCVSKLQDGTVLLSTSDGIFLYSYNNGKFLPGGHVLEGIPANKTVVTDTQVLVCKDKGFLAFRNSGRQTFAGTPDSYLDRERIRDIASAGDGNIWVLADSLFKVKNGNTTTYSLKNGLPENIMYIFCDKAGLLWLAHRKGITLLGDEYYEFTPVRNDKEELDVAQVNTDRQNKVWMGTGDGLALKEDDGYRLYESIGNVAIGYTTAFFKRGDGRLLAATSAGLLSIDAGTIRKEYDLQATAMAEDASGNLWLGDNYGHFFIGTGPLKQLKVDRYVSDPIACLFVDDHAVWVGYRGIGARKYELIGDSLALAREYTATDGFSDMRVRSGALDDKGNILFGTRTNGLYVISKGSGTLVAHITAQNGLSANWIKGIEYDADGKLYLATNNNINILSGDYGHPIVKQLRINNENFSRETNCIFRKGNAFYVGTNEGILKWMPGNMRKDTFAPPVYFTRVDIQGVKSFSVAPYTRDAGTITLPYDQHTIAFEFAGISLKAPGDMRYQYMLEGQNNEWSPVTDVNYVAYNLKPGSYTFKVAAKNGDGVVSRVPAVFHFVIRPPFWNTWWFISLVVAIVALATYGLYRYKLSQALALEQLRNKISTDLHDDIGSTLSSISILSDMAMKEPSQTYLVGMIKGIKENSASLLEKMDDIVWSINPKNDTLENLMVRMQRFAAPLLEAKNIDYHIAVAPSIKNVKLTMAFRQHLYLIVKEAINNLVKYSNASVASISVTYRDKVLEITVQDNGIGFDADAKQFGNGMINMRQRAKLMNAVLTVNSKPGAGTVVSVSMKIK